MDALLFFYAFLFTSWMILLLIEHIDIYRDIYACFVSGRKCGARLPRPALKMDQHLLRGVSIAPPYLRVTCIFSGVEMETYRSKISGDIVLVSLKKFLSLIYISIDSYPVIYDCINH